VLRRSWRVTMVENVLSALRLESPDGGADAAVPSVSAHFQGFHTVAKPLAIVFDSLGLRLTNGKVVLAGVTGVFHQSHMIAIMGPSGCGKSTFLNVLSSKATYGMMTGEVEVLEVTTKTDLNANSKRLRTKSLQRGDGLKEAPSLDDVASGSAASTSPSRVRASPSRGAKKGLGLMHIRLDMGYVPQDDTVHDELTVIENLRFSAFMRLGRGTSYKTLMNLVYDTIHVLQLTHVATSIVGSVEKRGISGGQRKRVNIGTELVAFPRVIFLDEPTSGLDATASSAILSGLQRICELGVLMAMVIHQPRYDIFTLFDSVLLLGPGGRTVYSGPSIQALQFFTSLGFTLPPNANPADFFLDVISGQVSRADAAGGHSSPTTAQTLFDLWEEQRDDFFQNSTLQLVSKKSRQTVQPLLRNDLERMFQGIEKNEAGEVTFTAFQSFVSTSLPSYLMDDAFSTQRDLKGLFKEMDQGHSNTITLNEFVAFFLGSPPASSAGKMLRLVSMSKAMEEGAQGQDDAAEVDSTQLRVDIEEVDGPAIQVQTRVKQSIWLLSAKLLEREIIMWLRNVGGHTVDLTLVLVSATIIGLVTGSQWETKNALQVSPPLAVIIMTRSPSEYQRLEHHRATLNSTLVQEQQVSHQDQNHQLAPLTAHLGLWGLRQNAVLSMLTLGVLATVASLRVFGKSRVVFWRESAAGTAPHTQTIDSLWISGAVRAAFGLRIGVWCGYEAALKRGVLLG
jgi:ABC-type multidrug transport system ATPase subunit